MSNCSFFEICHREAEYVESGEGYCILHAPSGKNKDAFSLALKEHRRTSNDFSRFVFPTAWFYRKVFEGPVNFSRATFPPTANFIGAHFTGAVDFSGANFTGSANFNIAKFDQEANLGGVHFMGDAEFDGAVFSSRSFLSGTKFAGKASFIETCFKQEATFGSADFSGNVEFLFSEFAAEVAFCWAKFRGKTIFRGRPEVLIFQECILDFRNVTNVSGTIHFENADLQRCEFEGTDCRDIEFATVSWRRKRGRTILFEEIVLQNGRTDIADKSTFRPNALDRIQWGEVERLYRQIKQNHEDRRDYERASTFHYGEKEMQRRNPSAPIGLRSLLFFYWLLSGYGERVLRPLCWIAGLLLYCSIVFIWSGLEPNGKDVFLTHEDFLQAMRYSFEVIFFLKPNDLVPQSPTGQWLRAIESVIGPIFIGLFALALRQRLRR